VQVAGKNRFRGEQEIKNTVRRRRKSAREGHQVHRPIPDALLPLQTGQSLRFFYQRVSFFNI
jgi:hypothetical protein